MKTVNDIVDEYKNRQETPEYSLIVIVDAKGKSWTYNDVTNLQTTIKTTEYVDNGRWVEFDSIYESKSRHIQIYNGHIIKYIKNIPEE